MRRDKHCAVPNPTIKEPTPAEADPLLRSGGSAGAALSVQLMIISNTACLMVPCLIGP